MRCQLIRKTESQVKLLKHKLKNYLRTNKSTKHQRLCMSPFVLEIYLGHQKRTCKTVDSN